MSRNENPFREAKKTVQDSIESLEDEREDVLVSISEAKDKAAEAKAQYDAAMAEAALIARTDLVRVDSEIRRLKVSLQGLSSRTDSRNKNN